MSDTGKVMIHGKAYETVASRVGRFREAHPDWTLETEIVTRDPEVVVMKAYIRDDKGRLISTGHAEEVRESSTINKTSALENAETSAIGRALAALGMGGTEFASADEVANAIRKQGVHKPSDGSMASLSADMQIHVRDLANEVMGFMKTGRTKEAVDWLEAANLDTDAKVACWALLPSDFRSSIKKYQDGKKAIKGLSEMKDDIP
jgi:hypothetical protein